MKLGSNWIKAYIIDVLPCITVAIYILAFIYNMAFFSVFNINIVHYLSLSDMLLSIMDVLITFAFLSLIVIWFGLFNLTTMMSTDRMERIRKPGKSKLLSRLPYKYRRLIIKVKNFWLFTGIRNSIKRWEKHEIESRKERIERRRKLEQDEYYHSWGTFIGTVIIMIVSFSIYLILQEQGEFYKGMMGATIGLVIPVLFSIALPMATYIDTKIIPGWKNVPIFKKYKTLEIVEIIIVYYIYAVTIFYVSGIDSGNYCKDNDIVSFSIKTSDGECFNDSAYRFINTVNEKVFLLEKETSRNVIMDNEGISYMVINYKDESNNSIIVRLVNKALVKYKENVKKHNRPKIRN